MEKQQLSNKEREDLANAISKLSDEDQMKIAAAGVITEKQCAKIKSSAPKVVCVDYGGPAPRGWPYKSIPSLSETETQELPGLMPTGQIDVDDNSNKKLNK